MPRFHTEPDRRGTRGGNAADVSVQQHAIGSETRSCNTRVPASSPPLQAVLQVPVRAPMSRPRSLYAPSRCRAYNAPSVFQAGSYRNPSIRVFDCARKDRLTQSEESSGCAVILPFSACVSHRAMHA